MDVLGDLHDEESLDTIPMFSPSSARATTETLAASMDFVGRVNNSIVAGDADLSDKAFHSVHPKETSMLPWHGTDASSHLQETKEIGSSSPEKSPEPLTEQLESSDENRIADARDGPRLKDSMAESRSQYLNDHRAIAMEDRNIEINPSAESEVGEVETLLPLGIMQGHIDAYLARFATTKESPPYMLAREAVKGAIRCLQLREDQFAVPFEDRQDLHEALVCLLLRQYKYEEAIAIARSLLRNGRDNFTFARQNLLLAMILHERHMASSDSRGPEKLNGDTRHAEEHAILAVFIGSLSEPSFDERSGEYDGQLYCIQLLREILRRQARVAEESPYSRLHWHMSNALAKISKDCNVLSSGWTLACEEVRYQLITTALRHPNVKLAEDLLSESTAKISGQSLLVYAVGTSSDEEMVRLLLKHGVKVLGHHLPSRHRDYPQLARKGSENMRSKSNQDVELVGSERLSRPSMTSNTDQDGIEHVAPLRSSAESQELCTPSKAFKELIAVGDINRAEEALETDFESIASGDLRWLRDLVDAGYCNDRIAELLIEVEADSPWLYYEPNIERQRHLIAADCHQKLCIHSAASRQPTDTPQSIGDPWLRSSDYVSPEQHDEIKRQVIEQCVLAGVVPVSRTTSEWDGQVIFEQKDNITTAFVSYESDQTRSMLDLLPHMQRIASRSRTAFALLQYHHGCCNSFTILRRYISKSVEGAVELCTIDADLLLRLLDVQTLNSLTETSRLGRACLAADEIIWIIAKISESPRDREHHKSLGGHTQSISGAYFLKWRVLHRISLALQIVSLGLLSYTRAHVGAVHPFFLAHEIHKLVLTRIYIPSERAVGLHVIAQLVHLTCMSGLTRDAVLAFHMSEDGGSISANRPPSDLMARPVDLIDTWGPGILIKETNQCNDVLGIEIGGGLLSRSIDRPHMLHWQSLQPYPATTPYLGRNDLAGFSLNAMARIGATQVNQNCPLQTGDELDKVRKACAEYLYDLGTSKTGWFPKARHMELQLGQYAIANFGLEFEKREGITVKDKILQTLEGAIPHIFLADLEAYYGLEVSSCTGVARRIPLRLLLANTLPAFIDSSIPGPPADWAKFGDPPVEALGGPSLDAWFATLPADYKMAATKVLGGPLIHLRSTGLDSEENLNNAWLCPQRVQLCFKLHCNDLNLWAKIFEDTDQCATFACITTTCLESDHIHRQGSNISPWRNGSELLTTEICRHADTSSGKITFPLQPFVLRENNKYWIGPTHAGLLASVSRTDSTTLKISRDWLRRIPEKHQRRILILQKAQRERLRERGATNGQTVLVAVRASRG